MYGTNPVRGHNLAHSMHWAGPFNSPPRAIITIVTPHRSEPLRIRRLVVAHLGGAGADSQEVVHHHVDAVLRQRVVAEHVGDGFAAVHVGAVDRLGTHVLRLKLAACGVAVPQR